MYIYTLEIFILALFWVIKNGFFNLSLKMDLRWRMRRKIDSFLSFFIPFCFLTSVLQKYSEAQKKERKGAEQRGCLRGQNQRRRSKRVFWLATSDYVERECGVKVFYCCSIFSLRFLFCFVVKAICGKQNIGENSFMWKVNGCFSQPWKLFKLKKKLFGEVKDSC